jgi:hypothetical protein
VAIPIPALEMTTITAIHFVRNVYLYLPTPAVTRRLEK